MKIVTLLTDFGDFYPGVMKGVILSLAPEAVIVDIYHNVEPQNVLQGAFLLYNSYRFFRNGVHVAVVDPGVGTERRAIAVKTKNHVFISPDNGISYPAASEDGIEGIYEVDVSISELVGELSSTFHGRDVFAPAAAMAVRGELSKYCKKIEDLKKFDLFDYEIKDDKIFCKVVFIDRFGNLVTNLRAEDVKDARGFYVKGREFPLVKAYAEVKLGETLSIIGSFRTLELSVRNGSAAEILNIKRGDIEIELEVIR